MGYLWFLICFLFFSLPAFSCSKEEIEATFRDQYEKFLDLKYFFSRKDDLSGHFCVGVKEFNKNALQGLNENIDFLKARSITFEDCNSGQVVDPFELPESLSDINDIATYSKMKELCDKKANRSQFEKFFEQDLEQLELNYPASQIAQFFQNVRNQYKSGRYVNISEKLTQIRCWHHLSTQACGFEISPSIDSIHSSLNEELVDLEQSCNSISDSQKSSLCRQAAHYLDTNILDESGSGSFNVVDDLISVFFSRFLNSKDIITSKETLYSRICFYQAIKAKLSCDESPKAQKVIEYYLLSHIESESSSVTVDRCAQEGIKIAQESELLGPSIKVYPNPSRGDFITIENIGAKVKNCKIKFQLVDMQGRTLQLTKNPLFDLSLPMKIDLPSSLGRGIYFLRPVEAVCADKVIKFNSMSSIEFVIQK